MSIRQFFKVDCVEPEVNHKERENEQAQGIVLTPLALLFPSNPLTTTMSAHYTMLNVSVSIWKYSSNLSVGEYHRRMR